MIDWIETPNIIKPKRIMEVEGSTEDSELHDIYVERFTRPLDTPAYEKLNRYREEIFSNLPDGSSLLLFGSGHPEFAKYIRKNCPNIGRMDCVDRVKEAGIGLIDHRINFHQIDILIHPIPRECDYVFSSHTLEHFTRNELIGKVLPRMRDAALRSVLAVVPYEDSWGGEPSHRCRFYYGDELFCLSRKYKIMHDNKELVLKI